MGPANIETCAVREALRRFVAGQSASRPDRARRDIECVVSLIEASRDGRA